MDIDSTKFFIGAFHMPIHIIIDGYNLIRSSSKLSVFDRKDIQTGREALLEKLGAYKKIKHHRITVVFDGQNTFCSFQHKDKIKGIEIKFSCTGETADAVIKRMAAREKEKALVVSSDRDVVDSSASYGAATIDSVQFEKKIEMAACMNTKGMDNLNEEEVGWFPTTKKKGPKRRLSKKRRKSMVKIRKL